VFSSAARKERVSVLFQKLLRVYSYLFAATASAAYLALGLISKISGTELSLDNMPWKGSVLADWLLGLAALGIISVLAAISGSRLRVLLIVFCAAVVFVTVKGNFLSTHSFAGADDFERTVALCAGAVIALLASLLQLKRPAPKV
jgi:uncharacterized membrane protein